MRESVETRVVDIKSFHVRIAFVWNVYGYLCAIACAFRWGVTLIGKFNYWALLTPSYEKKISGTGGIPGDEAHPRVVS